MNDETKIPQEQESARGAELEFNHDYDLMRAYAEQLNGVAETEE
ncbi:hypothetical protein [Paenibacillus oryzisoli]|nr:hypothetical protein [Paenibacillus oryzisoli]